MRRRWMVVLAALLALGLAGPASAVVIGFDDLPTTGAGTRVTVNAQYGAQGVTFNNVAAIDRSDRPGLARSAPFAVEQCFAIEFCTTPIEASFTTGQLSVKVWVGGDFAPAQPVPVRLTALDANGATVGTANGTIPVASPFAPTNVPLEVTAGSPVIRRLQVSSPGGFMNGVVVDDVEFSAAGPPPACTVSGPPVVRLVQPASGTVAQRNEFTLQGSVTPGAQILSARILVQGTGARSANVYPTVIRPEGGDFGPIRVSGLLLPGDQKVYVEATNCAGTGTDGGQIVSHRPLPATTRFRLQRLEITQGVQTSENEVPVLAAGANGTKRTFVRAHLTVEGGPDRVTGVSATLTGSRPDGSPLPGPLGVAPLEPVAVTTAPLSDNRRTLQGSLTFEVPRAWLAEGQVHLQVTRIAVEGLPVPIDCVGCDNRVGTQPRLTRVHRTPPVRLQIVSIPYTIGNAPTVHAPRQRDIDLLASWLRRAYPADRVEIVQTSLATQAGPPRSCDDVNAMLSDFADGLSPRPDERTRYYGLVDDNSGGNFMRGCAVIGGRVASGPTGSGTFGWDTDGSYGDWYGAHELAHTYNRLHPGHCDNNSRDDRGFPYAGGLIGTPVFDSQGFDAGDASLNLPMAVRDFRDGWADVMTYCNRQWVSSYTYRGILNDLCRNDRPNCPSDALAGATARSTTRQLQRSRSVVPRGLAVTGTLIPATGRLRLLPSMVVTRARVTERPRRGRYAIRLLGAGGRELARYPFDPREQSDPPGERERNVRALVDETVPFVAGTRRIVVTDGSRRLAAVPVSSRPPRVRILSPRRGRLRGIVTLRWSARDPDGGRLFSTVLYSPDGRRFTPIASKIRPSRLRVDMRTLPGGPRPRFRVVVTDGVLTGAATTGGRFRAPASPPRVAITGPADGTAVDPDVPVPLTGVAADPRDGTLGGGRLVWISSLQGRLGTGSTVAPSLRPGTHVITLTARNRAGRTARATVTVTVRDPLPPVIVATP
jgi:hypothetical protein